MNTTLIVIALIVLIVIIFIVYKNQKFKKHSLVIQKLRIERVQPLYDKLNGGTEVTKEEVQKYAQDHKTRETTYQLLVEHKQEALFPKEFLTIEHGAESSLVNWLEFPTELDKIPDEIEHLKKVTFDFDGNDVIYHVFKYRTDPPHWAAKNGWMLGVVGPYFDDSKPYDFPGATFSRCDSKLGEITPEAEVKWVHENIALRRA